MTEFIEKISNALQATSWIERLAVGFISVLFQARLYAEILLNMYYLVMSFYGLWYWKFRNQQAEVPITRCTKGEWRTVFAIVVLGYGALFLFLRYFTDSDVPILDAIVSSSAWAGMWLLAKRKIENWILLNISNFIAVPLLFYKDLYLFACLTIFLFIVAIGGYIKWRSIMKDQFHSNSHPHVA